MAYEIIKMNENTWRIEDGFHVRFFLLTGSEKAMLIDCGMTVRNAKEIAAELTDLPLSLILTHADPDHIGSLDAFNDFYMSPAEEFNLFGMQKKTCSYTPVKEGDIIDLGDRPLEIVALPGHTAGCIGILDLNAKAFFTGDPIQDGMIFMFGPHRDITSYRETLLKVNAMKDRFDVIYPSHGTIPVEKDLVMKLYNATSDILAGGCFAFDMDFHGMPVKCYDMKIAKFLMDK
ncbi:MAG: MBL fold metallo-hydrolase [Lachnospiraceae bacterium]|nr:MBL fold metallo-hydrolase [Lachnospiraceae bacterium]